MHLWYLHCGWLGIMSLGSSTERKIFQNTLLFSLDFEPNPGYNTTVCSLPILSLFSISYSVDFERDVPHIATYVKKNFPHLQSLDEFKKYILMNASAYSHYYSKIYQSLHSNWWINPLSWQGLLQLQPCITIPPYCRVSIQIIWIY